QAPAQTQAQPLAQTQAQPPAQAQAAELPQPAAQAPLAQARTEAGQPPLIWIPIPLENGKQGWAQLQIQEGESGQRRDGRASHQVRLWWETPALGQIQVTLDASGPSLTALFTVLLASIRQGVERGLTELQQRLAEAGFDEVQVGCRQVRPGESIGPALPAGSGPRLDRRL
ncbi:MAG: flagellar hook-length control protein FliK, partial [Bacillota bacterium]